jgi:hypothetical protein
MDSKALLFGIIGFLFGGLVVSFAATQLEDTASASEMTMSAMSAEWPTDGRRVRRRLHHQHDRAPPGRHRHGQTGCGRAKHPEIKGTVSDISTAQQGEIAQMRQWQQRWGYAAEPSNTGH